MCSGATAPSSPLGERDKEATASVLAEAGIAKTQEEPFALLVVDAAYVHCGRSRTDVGRGPDSDQNSWAELEGFDPKLLRRRVEESVGAQMSHCVWFGAQDGRLDSGGKHLQKRLVNSGFELRFRRMKVDEVHCRNRNCDGGTCRHRFDPIFVRRQAGVDVDITARTLELVYARAPMSAIVVLVAGDGDLAPLAEALLRANCELYLLAFRHSVSHQLASLAYDFFDLDDEYLVNTQASKKRTSQNLVRRFNSNSDLTLLPDLNSDFAITDLIPAQVLASHAKAGEKDQRPEGEDAEIILLKRTG